MTTIAPPTTGAVLSVRDRNLTVVGLLLALLLGALDQTIVATAGPAIQRSLAIEPSLYVWLTTAYLVASTVMVPIYGKLGDLYGRKPIMLFGLGVFLVGSLMSGLSGNAVALILFRGLQGLGAGALFTTAFAIVADLYPPAERGRIGGSLGGVFGLSSVLGPLVGGFITDNFSWNWVFLVNLPVGVLAVGFIVAFMPWLRPSGHQKPSVDVAGAILLVTAVVPLLLALSFGKSTILPGETGFLWGSWQILAMFATFAVATVAFLFTEARAKDPLVDLRLLSNRTFAVGNGAIFLLGAGFLAAIVFLPLFMVNVVGLSATNSGLTTTPLTFGLIAGAITSGALTTRYGRYKPFMLAGLVLLVIGFALMAFTLTPLSTQLEVTLKMIVVGLGMGPVVSLYTLAVQNAVPADKTGVATSSVSFFQSMGGTIGLAILGTVFASSLTGGISNRMAEATATLPPSLRAQFAAQPRSTVGGTFNVAAIRKTVKDGFAQQEAALAKAFSGDAVIARALLGNPQTPVQLKVPLQAAAEGKLPPAAAAATLEGAREGLKAAQAATLDGVNRLDFAFKQGFTDAITSIYLIGIFIILAGALVTTFIPEIPLRKGDGEEFAPSFA